MISARTLAYEQYESCVDHLFLYGSIDHPAIKQVLSSYKVAHPVKFAIKMIDFFIIVNVVDVAMINVYAVYSQKLDKMICKGLNKCTR